MKEHLKRQIINSLVALQFHKLVRGLIKNKVVILMYHGFVEDTQLRPWENNSIHLEIGKFSKQIQYLKSNHNVVSLESVVAHYRDGKSLPEYPVVITVDDGYESFYHLALPLLIKANLPATVFLTTNFVDHKEMLWPDRLDYAITNTTIEKISFSLVGQPYCFRLRNSADRAESRIRLIQILRHLDNATRLAMVEELERQTSSSLNTTLQPPPHLKPMYWHQVVQAVDTGLVSIGSHTVSHPVLTNCSVEEIRSELLVSKTMIETQLGQACKLFCYPFGTSNDFSPMTRQLVKEAGYTSALTTVVGMNNARADAYTLKRYMVDNRADWHALIARVNGLLSIPHGLAK